MCIRPFVRSGKSGGPGKGHRVYPFDSVSRGVPERFPCPVWPSTSPERVLVRESVRATHGDIQGVEVSGGDPPPLPVGQTVLWVPRLEYPTRKDCLGHPSPRVQGLRGEGRALCDCSNLRTQRDSSLCKKFGDDPSPPPLPTSLGSLNFPRTRGADSVPSPGPGYVEWEVL